MKHVVTLSGGLGSFATAKVVCDTVGPENVELVFTDTKSEDEDLYRFLNETVEYLGAYFIKLEDGRDLWQVFNDYNFMSNSRIANCSQTLKQRLFTKWLKNRYKPDECILYYGIDWTEEHRAVKIAKNWAPYQCGFPLVDNPRLNKMQILQDSGIKIPRLYEMGFAHNNCGGFCVKAGLAHFKILLDKMPERYAYHESKQEELFKKIGRKGFLVKTVKGENHYLGLKEFREMMQSEKQKDEETKEQLSLDYGGCGCFS